PLQGQIFRLILLLSCRKCTALIVQLSGPCSTSEFWNSDLDVCVPCASCKHSVLSFSLCCAVMFCPAGRPVIVEDPSDVWRLAAITSFSVLAVVLVGAALIIGVMVHRRKSQKRPLRGKTRSPKTDLRLNL
uniref:TNFR-Cys domain-containing protein n=1 Tax=Myripristis murdjan TaxID=586833 RepID=A0A667ZFE4_9TELE